MVRRRSRFFACCALVAMALLLAMPTVGRSFGGGFALPGEDPSVAAHGMAHEGATPDMASMSPAAHAAHMRHMRPGMGKDADRAPARHAGHDCAYCPLLSGLAQTASVPPPLLAPMALAPWTVRAVVAPPPQAPVPALGSQGPPGFERA